MGAAIQGGLIAGIDVGPVLVDISPHTLGIECAGEVRDRPSLHCFARLIERNTPLPSSRSELFTTMHDGQKNARIAVFQGEDDDARHNQPVGEFVLDGLANVDRGNEILVRFDLDLDGILKVSATERATGLQRELTIDNAVTRFKASSRADAYARVEATFLGGREADATAAVGMAPAGATPAEAPPESDPLVARCRQLIAKSQQLAGASNAADAAEMAALAEQLRAAIARNSQPDMESVAARLEDIVFYLQDA
jgi:molecular chaperone DnaK